MAKITCCQECGGSLVTPGQNRPMKATKKFCSQPCRMAFNNRRRDRGAEIYDLFMAIRFDRANAAQRRVWSLMCSQAAAYRDADNHRRQGRKSWQSLDDAIEALPMFRSATAGDNR